MSTDSVPQSQAWHQGLEPVSHTICTQEAENRQEIKLGVKPQGPPPVTPCLLQSSVCLLQSSVTFKFHKVPKGAPSLQGTFVGSQQSLWVSSCSSGLRRRPGPWGGGDFGFSQRLDYSSASFQSPRAAVFSRFADFQSSCWNLQARQVLLPAKMKTHEHGGRRVFPTQPWEPERLF